MHKLNSSHRCDLFKQIADYVWDKIIDSHAYGNQVPEIGITNDIVTVIRRHASTIPNFGVWANHGYNENLYGSDIDVFVEITKGNFIWYALQAKVLRLNGKYLAISKLINNEYQWDKLNRLHSLTGCITKYLFYNGIKNFTFTGKDSCGFTYSETQLGCALVDTNDVKKIALTKTPTFSDFHTQLADPWRTIVCCFNDVKSTLFSLPQINDAVSYYEKDFGPDIDEVDDNNQLLNDYPISNIRDSNLAVNRDPIYTVVIRTTESLNTE